MEFKKKTKNNIINHFVLLIFILVLFILLSYFFLETEMRTAMFYLTHIAVSLLLIRLSTWIDNEKIENFIILLSFIIVFSLYGLRNFSATDDTSYLRNFIQLSYTPLFEYFKNSTMEIGYLLLNKLVIIFKRDYLTLQIITALIPMIYFYRGFLNYKTKINLPLALFLFYCFIYFQMLAVGLVRMFIAVSIVFYAFKFVLAGRTKMYIFYVLFASLFHYSALFLLVLVYFTLDEKNILNNYLNYFLLILVIAPIFAISISQIIVPLLGVRYQLYSNINDFSFNIADIMTIPLVIYLGTFKKHFATDELPAFNLALFIFSLSIIIDLVSNFVSFGRIVYFSYTGLIIVASMISQKTINSAKLNFHVILIVFSLLYLFYSQFLNQDNFIRLFPHMNLFFTI